MTWGKGNREKMEKKESFKSKCRQKQIGVSFIWKYTKQHTNEIDHICFILLPFKCLKVNYWEFPGGPVVKTLPSNARFKGLIPIREVRIPYASQPGNQNIK